MQWQRVLITILNLKLVWSLTRESVFLARQQTRTDLELQLHKWNVRFTLDRHSLKTCLPTSANSDDVRHLYFLSHKSTDLSLKCPLKIVCYRRALIIWNVSLLTDIFYLKCVSVVDIDNYPFMSAKTLLASQVWRLQVKNSPVQRLPTYDAMTQPTYVLCYTNFNHRNVGNNRHREILFGMC